MSRLRDLYVDYPDIIEEKSWEQKHSEDERALRPYSAKALLQKKMEDLENNERWVPNKYRCLGRQFRDYDRGRIYSTDFSPDLKRIMKLYPNDWEKVDD